jgi:hypothetical protein
MPQEQPYQDFLDRLAGLRSQVVTMRAGDIASNPSLADELLRQIDDMYQASVDADSKSPKPADNGLAQLAGIGDDAAKDLGDTRMPQGVAPYDESVSSERITAIGDLYYIYQHEKIGVFRVIRKLKELFNAGAVRLSNGPGAFKLYQFDRRDVLRYTITERLAAYRRAFGYGSAAVMPNATPNQDFHPLFTHFINQVALFWRDKRISDVIRERAFDPSFGSIAIVRRAGLDLRNNLKFTSYGHINVMRVEVMQLLDDAWEILGSDDVKRLFGVTEAWDVVEEILVRYFNERLVTSPRQRMAVAGREVLRWLAQPHIMKMQRVPFESLLLQIAEYSEEWLTSAQSMGLARRMDANRVLPWDSTNPVEAVRAARPSRNGNGAGRSVAAAARRPVRSATARRKPAMA